jgi:TPR repeat protein
MKPLQICSLIYCMLLLATLSCADNLDEALRAAGFGDYKKAHDLLLVDAEKGNAVAQTNLGLLYNDGLGVTQDDREAVRWYSLAAEKGYPRAEYYLGVMFEEGRGVPQDYIKAAQNYRLAAEKGYVKAQFALGMMYLKGQGLIQSTEYAYAWWSLAATNGHEEAQKYKESAEEQMTPKQIATAQQIARQLWTELGY